VEWLKVQALSSTPNTAKIKKGRKEGRKEGKASIKVNKWTFCMLVFFNIVFCTGLKLSVH
jgi:hypothetical protein